MSDDKETVKTPYKAHYYQIVLRALRAACVTVQSNGHWLYATSNLAEKVFIGHEYVTVSLYGRKTAKEAIFGGIQHYQVSLPDNPIVKRVFINWRKQNPIDPKGKIKNEVLWIYPKDFTGLQQLIEAWPIEEKQRRIEAAEEAEHYQWQLENGYFDDDDDDDYEEDFGYYWENM